MWIPSKRYDVCIKIDIIPRSDSRTKEWNFLWFSSQHIELCVHLLNVFVVFQEPNKNRLSFATLQLFFYLCIHVCSHLLSYDKDNAYNVAECFPDAPSVCIWCEVYFTTVYKNRWILWKSASSRFICKTCSCVMICVEFVCTISVRLYLSMCIMCVPVDFTMGVTFRF